MLSNLKWWVAHRFHPRHRYNILKTSLKPGYYDPCVRIESAILDETQKFFEYTKDLIYWDSDKEHQEASEAFENATKFWKAHRKAIQDGKGCSYEERERLAEQAKLHLREVIQHLDFMWYP